MFIVGESSSRSWRGRNRKIRKQVMVNRMPIARGGVSARMLRRRGRANEEVRWKVKVKARPALLPW
jgi:hypothetical protein